MTKVLGSLTEKRSKEQQIQTYHTYAICTILILREILFVFYWQIMSNTIILIRYWRFSCKAQMKHPSVLAKLS